jgi:hypothetical protein
MGENEVLVLLERESVLLKLLMVWELNCTELGLNQK